MDGTERNVRIKKIGILSGAIIVAIGLEDHYQNTAWINT